MPHVPPPTPRNEVMRLATLRSLRILDTPAEERFDRVTRLAQRIFATPTALVSLVDDDRQWYKSRQGLDATETPRDISFCGHAICDRKPLVVTDAAEDPRFADNPLVTGAPHIRFYAGSPIDVGNDCRIGTVCVIDQEPRHPDDVDLALLEDLAKMVAGELRALRMATTDELTGLVNRRGFNQLTEHTLELARRHARPCTLMFIDLDGFKAINDVLGHDVGDVALVEMSKVLCRTFRRSDVIARLGGDEFCVVLTEAPASTADDVSARLRQEVDRWHEATPRNFQLAFSVGVAAFDPKRHRDLDDLLQEADATMYAQKRQRKVRSRSA